MKLAARWLLGVIAGMVIIPTALVLSVLPASSPVQAQGVDCGEYATIPYHALEDAVVGTSTGGAYTTGTAGTALLARGGATLTAEGATTVATGGATAKIAVAAAALTGSMYATCRFLDWTNWWEDDAAPPPPTYGVSTQVTGDHFQCNGAPEASGIPAAYDCVTITLASPIPVWGGSEANGRRVRSNTGGIFNIGANYFPSVTYGPLYRNPSSYNPVSAAGLGWVHPNGGLNNCTYSASGGTCNRWNVSTHNITLTRHCEGGVDTNGVAVGGNVTYRNIGGNCGQHPGEYGVIYDNNISTVHFLVHPNPYARDWGWERRIFADVQCKNGPGGTTTWVRDQSPAFMDAGTKYRIPMPTCPDGYIPITVLITRVPTPVECSVGVACFGNDSIITSVALPPAMTTVGTAPDWVTCLAADATCGAPVLESPGVCEWGGIEVDADFCTETERTNGTDPRTQLSPSPEVDLGDDPVYDPVDTQTPPDVPPGGGGGTDITVNVPIDEGRGEGAIPMDGDDEECWPDGWGWFNPAEWVYRPIKCALVWAFVPEDFGGWIDEQAATLEGEAPISFAVDGFALVTAGADAPSSVRCFGALDGPGALGSGSVCAQLTASGLTTSEDDRTVILAIMVALTVLLGLVSFVWMLS